MTVGTIPKKATGIIQSLARFPVGVGQLKLTYLNISSKKAKRKKKKGPDWQRNANAFDHTSSNSNLLIMISTELVGVSCVQFCECAMKPDIRPSLNYSNSNET